MDESGTGVIDTQATIMGTDVDGGSRVHSSISEDVPQRIHPIESPVANALHLNDLASFVSIGTDLVLQPILPSKRQRHCKMVV